MRTFPHVLQRKVLKDDYNKQLLSKLLVSFHLLSESVASRPAMCAVDWLSPVGPLSESDVCLSACNIWGNNIGTEKNPVNQNL